MAITDDFFNVSHYEVLTKIEQPRIEPNVEFTVVFDIVDIVRWGTPTVLTSVLYTTSGRNETALPTVVTWTAPPVIPDDVDGNPVFNPNKAQWTAVGTIDSADWDGKASLRLDMIFDDTSTYSYQLVGSN